MRPWFKNASAIPKGFTHTFLIVVLWAFYVPVSAELGDRAAIVEVINGLSDLFEVWRDGNQLSVYPLMVLQKGDILYIRQAEDQLLEGNKQVYVKLTFGGNQSETICGKKLDGNQSENVTCKHYSPYEVKKRDTTPSIAENMATDTKSWLTTLYQHYYDTVITITKSPEFFSIPLLTKYKTQKVVVTKGKRVLHLGWRSGTMPYQVCVYPQNEDKNDWACKTSNSKQVWFEREWHPGYYQVVIRDKYKGEGIRYKNNGSEIKGYFRVVKGLSPKLPKQEAVNLKKSTMPWQATWRAVWLAQQENGVWRFEAYQQIFDLAEKQYQPALVLREGLEAGK